MFKFGVLKGNAIVEATNFGWETVCALLRYFAGEISRDELYWVLCREGCESMGSFLGGGAAVATLAPFLAPSAATCIVIGTLGSLIGRKTVAKVGNKLS